MTKVSKEFTLLDLCEKLLLFLYSVFEIIHTHCHKDTLQEQVCWPQVCLCSALARLCHTRQECWWWRDCRWNDFTGSHCHGAQTPQTLLTFITSHHITSHHITLHLAEALSFKTTYIMYLLQGQSNSSSYGLCHGRDDCRSSWIPWSLNLQRLGSHLSTNTIVQLPHTLVNDYRSNWIPI